MKFLLTLFSIVLFVIAGSDDRVFIDDNYQIEKDTIAEGWSEINFKKSEIINRMAYADTANFMHQKIYPCARCFLRPEVVEAVQKANEKAKEKGLQLVIYDCYRPYQFQYKMFEIVNNPKYVAEPGKGSNHNRGVAVDLSLTDAEGNLLDMGGGFDDFSKISHYSAKGLSKKARKNRRLLRNIMKEAGFVPYEYEWWHFDFKNKDYPVADFVWSCEY